MLREREARDISVAENEGRTPEHKAVLAKLGIAFGACILLRLKVHWLPGPDWARLCLHHLPYLAAGLLTALLLTRLRWLAATGVALSTALTFWIAMGLYWHIALPSEADYNRQLEDPAGRILAVLDVFSREPSVSFAPPWSDIILCMLPELALASVAALVGSGLGWLLTRAWKPERRT